jgi:hypothetical protein
MEPRPRSDNLHGFQCPMPGCSRRIFKENFDLNKHIRNCHPRDGFFWCVRCRCYIQGEDAYRHHREVGGHAEDWRETSTSLSATNHANDMSGLHFGFDQTSTAVADRVSAGHLSRSPTEQANRRGDVQRPLSGGVQTLPGHSAATSLFTTSTSSIAVPADLIASE